MDRRLSPDERTQLLVQHRKERDGKIRDRIKAVLAFDDGYSYSEISRILLLDDETIRRHIADYFNKHKLSPGNGGSQSLLSCSQVKKLSMHLREVTYLHVKDICAYVKLEFGLSYSISGMRNWLRVNGFSYKKPHTVPAKANAKEQQRFIDFYHELKLKVLKEPIYFADSVHPRHQAKPAYGWIFKGERKQLPTNSKQKGLNIIGGINLSGHKFCYEVVDKVDADAVALFLTKLRKRHPEKMVIHIILDNAGYHKDATVQDFAESLGIKLHYLPPYSPNLNPIERMWKIMHELVTYNKYYATFAEFKEATTRFLATIGRQKRLLRSRITDNFNVINSPIFAS